VTLTFDLAFCAAFRWAKTVRPISRSKYRLRPKLSWTLV